MLAEIANNFVQVVSSPLFQIELAILVGISLLVMWRLRSLPRVRRYRQD